MFKNNLTITNIEVPVEDIHAELELKLSTEFSLFQRPNNRSLKLGNIAKRTKYNRNLGFSRPAHKRRRHLVATPCIVAHNTVFCFCGDSRFWMVSQTSELRLCILRTITVYMK